MSDIVDHLREELKDPEYSEAYAESFLDSYIATQIKVLREQRGMSQNVLAEKIGMRQNTISRIENVDYSKWNMSTLKRLARAFNVRLKVSFETYGTLLAEVATYTRQSLEREPRENDKLLSSPAPCSVPQPSLRTTRRRHRPKLSRISGHAPREAQYCHTAIGPTRTNNSVALQFSGYSFPTKWAETAQGSIQ